MIRVLGIDPGSRKTGYGIVESAKQHNRFIEAGVIELKSKSMPQRLSRIYKEIDALIQEYQPDHVAIEQVFMNKNVASALKLGQARGAAICAAAKDDNEVFEYSAREVKLAVVGTGGASKHQVQHMTRILLNLKDDLKEDAADALAIALCHSHTWLNQQTLLSSR